MGLVLQATYLSPRPEWALGQVPLEQPPWLKGPGPRLLAQQRLCSTMPPAAKRGHGFRTELTLD